MVEQHLCDVTLAQRPNVYGHIFGMTALNININININN